MTLAAVDIQSNTAKGGGGGVYVSNGTLTLTNVKINAAPNLAGNKAPYGGGMYIYRGQVKMTAGSVANNSATAAPAVGALNGMGGGICNNLGTLTIQTAVKVASNKAKGNGGGFYFASGSTTTFNPAPPIACTIAGNTVAAGGMGPGAYAQNAGGVLAKVNGWNPKGLPQNVFDNDDGGGVYKTGP